MASIATYEDIKKAINETVGPFIISDIQEKLPSHVDWTIIREILWYWVDQGLIDITHDRMFVRESKGDDDGK